MRTCISLGKKLFLDKLYTVARPHSLGRYSLASSCTAEAECRVVGEECCAEYGPGGSRRLERSVADLAALVPHDACDVCVEVSGVDMELFTSILAMYGFEERDVELGARGYRGNVACGRGREIRDVLESYVCLSLLERGVQCDRL